MEINVFDSNWGDQVGSVLGRIPHYAEYVRGKMKYDGITLFTDAWITNKIVDEVESKYKIGWLHEPYCLWPHVYEQSVALRHKFDIILTYYEPYLDMEGFAFAPYAGVWIPDEEWGMKPKTKLTSMLVGTKASTLGHRIRLEAANMLDRYFDVDFYGAKGTPVGYGPAAKVKSLEDYRFSVITETCYEDNLFSEWTLDAFSQGTVPILFACPNIAEFFNPAGIILWQTVDELREIMGRLSIGMYEEMRPAVEDNLTRIRQYACTDDWLYENVFRLVE